MLDTDVMIDLLRGFPPAVTWLSALGAIDLVVPGYVVMELLQGCRNRSEQDQIVQTLLAYQITWPSAGACNAALQDYVHSI